MIYEARNHLRQVFSSSGIPPTTPSTPLPKQVPKDKEKPAFNANAYDHNHEYISLAAVK